MSYPPEWHNLPGSGSPDTDKYFSNQFVGAPLEMTATGVWLTLKTISGACPATAGRIDGQAQLFAAGQLVTRTYGYLAPPGAESAWTIAAAIPHGSTCYAFGFMTLTQAARDRNLAIADRMISSFQFVCSIPPLPGLCVGRLATVEEETAMIAVGVPALEADLGLTDWSTCSGSQSCFQLGSPSRAMVGSNAGTFYGTEGCKNPCGGAACWVFLYRDTAGWHYANARCVQSPGYVPGPQDIVRVSGCANVRSAPGMASQVLDCIQGGTFVDVDSAPVYLDGHIWWHLARHGWMAHDFLVAPKGM